MASRKRRKKKPVPPNRLCIVYVGGQWYIRRIRLSVHDLEKDEKVYHCDQPLGGPYDALVEVLNNALKLMLP